MSDVYQQKLEAFQNLDLDDFDDMLFGVVDLKDNRLWLSYDAILDDDDLTLILDGDGLPQYKLDTSSKPALSAQLIPAGPATGLMISQSISQDPLVQLAQQAPESPEVLNQLVQGMLEETASMRQERRRIQHSNPQQSTANLSSKTVSAMKQAADIFLKRRELDSNVMIDLESPQFKAIFMFIMQTFMESLKASGLRTEQVDTIMNNLYATMKEDSWDIEARRRMKNPN